MFTKGSGDTSDSVQIGGFLSTEQTRTLHPHMVDSHSDGDSVINVFHDEIRGKSNGVVDA